MCQSPTRCALITYPSPPALQLGVLFGYFAAARAAAAELYELIDRVPPIDPFDASGEQPRAVRGRIEFRDVTFAYPSRPDAPVLQNFSLVIEAGQRVGVCGPSGSGELPRIRST